MCQAAKAFMVAGPKKYNDTVNKVSVNPFANANQTIVGSTCILDKFRKMVQLRSNNYLLKPHCNKEEMF